MRLERPNERKVAADHEQRERCTTLIALTSLQSVRKTSLALIQHREKLRVNWALRSRQLIVLCGPSFEVLQKAQSDRADGDEQTSTTEACPCAFASRDAPAFPTHVIPTPIIPTPTIHHLISSLFAQHQVHNIIA